MKDYNFTEIEQKWQEKWRAEKVYRVAEDTTRPKCYVLDMFPYPSGAGLHVGHPLGYIASDIYARYKRLKGYNVLHPMGYDAFGLPAEQYAIQTGQHPAVTTEKNIARYREQMDKIGFSYDWDREVRTSDPAYYKWTQWVFIQLFNSWYNPKTDKAEPIDTLISILASKGYTGTDDSVLTGGIELDFPAFTAEEWAKFTNEQQQAILLGFRLAYLSEAYVNWCPALGTVLSNDEVKDGVSERGGHPVERKLMNQWSMRITAYADRLLKDLDTLDWTESLKESQRNWIGKSQGASVNFKVQDRNFAIEVFTTRPDTIFGVSFIVIAPEHEMLQDLVTTYQMDEVMSYVDEAKNRSERERQADVKRISGAFTGMYAVHPFTGQEIPIWVADYVLAGYGTGAVMAVPAHDSRDHAFARHFGLPVVPVVELPTGHDLEQESYDAKTGKVINSEFLNGLEVKKAIRKAIEFIEKGGFGKGKTNFRLRDAIFGRQRYWGEPIPVYYKDGVPNCIPEDKLPLELPMIDKFLPTEDGEPPLARAEKWMWNETLQALDTEGYPVETTTMPGWAGSSWYFLRYMDPGNNQHLVGKTAVDYWQNVDLYLGGSEHATGHLLYVRFWTKFLFDRGFIPVNEPAQKLINQGMIQGVTSFFTAIGSYGNTPDAFGMGQVAVLISDDIKTTVNESESQRKQLADIIRKYNPGISDEDLVKIQVHSLSAHRADVSYVQNGNEIVSMEEFAGWAKNIYGYGHVEFILNDQGKFICDHEVEKMSKSKWNVVTPDDIISSFGADTLRLYEMFLGPLEQSKPWSTQGIEGVHRFLRKLWRLFYNLDGNLIVTDAAADKKELKVLHTLIRKVGEDIERFSFNTSVSSFMICVNELTELKCSKKEILEAVLICLNPYAPHITEELWSAIGHKECILTAAFPVFNPDFLVEDSFSYPISINGKHRTNLEMSLAISQEEVEKLVLSDESVQKWLEGKTPRKIIFVKGKIVNMVV
jgi:leucyl-tRNA synthetase